MQELALSNLFLPLHLKPNADLIIDDKLVRKDELT